MPLALWHPLGCCMVRARLNFILTSFRAVTVTIYPVPCTWKKRMCSRIYYYFFFFLFLLVLCFSFYRAGTRVESRCEHHTILFLDLPGLLCILLVFIATSHSTPSPWPHLYQIECQWSSVGTPGVLYFYSYSLYQLLYSHQCSYPDSSCSCCHYLDHFKAFQGKDT